MQALTNIICWQNWNSNYDRAFALLQAMKTVDLNAEDLLETCPPPAALKTELHCLPAEHQQKRRQVANTRPCYRCGGKHSAAECCFRDADRHYYCKKGHIAWVCHSRFRAQSSPRKSQGTQHLVEPKHLEFEQLSTDYPMFQLRGSADPLLVAVTANHKVLTMEVNIGAALSVISESTYHSAWSEDVRPPLKHSNAKLRTYSGEILPIYVWSH